MFDYKVFLSSVLNTLLGLVAVYNIEAQSVGDWQAYASHAEATHLATTSQNHIWVSTGGGILEIEGADILREYSLAQGLYQLSVSAMAYDAGRQYIWRGYGDGTIERINMESGSIVQYADIRRVERYSSRGVNALHVIDDYLYASTDFGVVVFDTQNGLVRESYTSFAGMDSGIPVRSITRQDDYLFVATDNGVIRGNRQDDLEVPANWQQVNTGLSGGSLKHIISWKEKVYAFTSSGTYVLEDEEWEQTGYFEGNEVQSVSVSNEGAYLTASTRDTVYVRDADEEMIWGSEGQYTVSSAEYHEDSQALYVANIERGVLQVDLAGGEVEHEIVPDGPFSNLFMDLNTDGTTLIAGSSDSPNRVATDFTDTGFYVFTDGVWHNYNQNTTSLMRDRNLRSMHRTGVGNAYHYFGSYGRGLVRRDKDSGDLHLYSVLNSPLRPHSSDSDTFVIIGGVDRDADGNMWVASWSELSDVIYHYHEKEEDWQTFNDPASLSGDLRHFGLMVDAYGQIWTRLTNDRFQGRGAAVMRENEEGQLEGVRLTEDGNQGSLPSEEVRDFAVDQRGEVWIATNNGIAYFNFPDQIIDGGSQEREATLVLNADTTATSPFLLNNVRSNAIEVNSANQKWVGTEDAGLWLISPVGGRYEVLEHFTTENSPLISDNITSLALDEETGTLYIATDIGLTSYVGTTKSGVEQMSDLRVYPNPYSYNEESGNIIVEGLSSATRLNVLTADGRVVNRVDTRGGRIECDCRDFQGNQVGSGVYVLVAVDEDNGERGTGKVVIIR